MYMRKIRASTITTLALIGFVLVGAAAAQAPVGPEPYLEDDYDGFEKIFDGTLEKWDGDRAHWRARGDSIVGQTRRGKPISQNTFLIWRGGMVKDFDLKLEFRMDSTNSGVQYRSTELPGAGKWVLRGYQADFDFTNEYTGALYEERGPRGLITRRGDMVKIEKRQRPRVIGRLQDVDEIKKHIKVNDWNRLHVVARGNVLMHILNGYVTSVVVDDDVPNRVSEGLIGLQIHTGDPMKVEFRNLYLKRY